MTDPNAINFIEQGIRGELNFYLLILCTTNPTFLPGGMSYINQRYAKAGKQTDQNTGEEFYNSILYIDGERANPALGGGGSCRPSQLIGGGGGGSHRRRLCRKLACDVEVVVGAL
jgi:hypothetical protein